MLGPGIALIAIGLLVALLVNSTLGIIVLILGLAAVALSFSSWGPGRTRHTTIIERDSRPVTRERETIREERL